MNHNQQKALIEACESGDDVRIVTIALQIAASAARNGESEKAQAVRRQVDEFHMREAAERARAIERDEFAKAVIPGIIVSDGDRASIKQMAAWSYEVADAMIEARNVKEVTE